MGQQRTGTGIDPIAGRPGSRHVAGEATSR
jgi:hypothetical protein